ncbi:hypothetical protein COO60DRAFT_849470 [Scenedesmus sp. NREL 46B-D3]|nr:hypothetical protein COO60DRAFT_849470 [Scenedesmus sp. NREL 46B-D3]
MERDCRYKPWWASCFEAWAARLWHIRQTPCDLLAVHSAAFYAAASVDELPCWPAIPAVDQATPALLLLAVPDQTMCHIHRCATVRVCGLARETVIAKLTRTLARSNAKKAWPSRVASVLVAAAAHRQQMATGQRYTVCLWLWLVNIGSTCRIRSQP